MSDFEKNLQEYFPEIYNLHVIGKLDGNVWVIVEQLMELHRTGVTGTLLINFNKGVIQKVSVQKDVLALTRFKTLDNDKNI